MTRPSGVDPGTPEETQLSPSAFPQQGEAGIMQLHPMPGKAQRVLRHSCCARIKKSKNLCYTLHIHFINRDDFVKLYLFLFCCADGASIGTFFQTQIRKPKCNQDIHTLGHSCFKAASSPLQQLLAVSVQAQSQLPRSPMPFDGLHGFGDGPAAGQIQLMPTARGCW